VARKRTKRPAPEQQDLARRAPRPRARKRRRRAGKRTLHYLLLLIIMLGAGATLFMTVLFQIEEIIVTGADRYADDEVIEVSGIETGENLLRLNTGRAADEILAAFPYIASVSVERRFPHRVELVITQYIPEAAAVEDGEAALITLEGKVLERGIVNIPAGLPLVRGLRVEDSQPGDMIGDIRNPDNQERLVMLRYLFEAAHSVNFGAITDINVTDRLNMSIVHQERVIVLLGSEADLEYKLTFARHIIDNEMEEDAQALLDASNARDRRLIRRDGKVVDGEFIPGGITFEEETEEEAEEETPEE